MPHNLADSILPGEVHNFHFVLKLWMVVNDEAVDYLRWNDKKTAIVVELGSLGTPYMSEMFAEQTVKDFQWLLKFNGFEHCPSETKQSLDSKHVVYRHAAFVMSNEQLFREWILEGPKESSTCWVKPGSLANEFRPREIGDYFQKAKAKITAEMVLLDAHIRREYNINKDHGASSMTIPSEYCDRIAIEEQEQTKMAHLPGYYGTAGECEIRNFYGTMLPVINDPSVMTETDYAILKKEEEKGDEEKEEEEDDAKSLTIDEDTPHTLTNSVRSLLTPLDFD